MLNHLKAQCVRADSHFSLNVKLFVVINALIKEKSEVLTVTAVSHLQVLVGAKTRVSKHRAAHFNSTVAFPVTTADSGKGELKYVV